MLSFKLWDICDPLLVWQCYASLLWCLLNLISMQGQRNCLCSFEGISAWWCNFTPVKSSSSEDLSELLLVCMSSRFQVAKQCVCVHKERNRPDRLCIFLSGWTRCLGAPPKKTIGFSFKWIRSRAGVQPSFFSSSHWFVISFCQLLLLRGCCCCWNGRVGTGAREQWEFQTTTLHKPNDRNDSDEDHGALLCFVTCWIGNLSTINYYVMAASQETKRFYRWSLGS